MNYHAFLDKEILILGCGNPLMGDDGFGSYVIRRLQKQPDISRYAAVIDVGTSIRDFLFDLLLSEEKKVNHLFVIDAVRHHEHNPGDIFKIEIDQIPDDKQNDFFVHQFPGSNILKEISQTAGITVHVYVVQAKDIPDRISPGLSPLIGKAVETLADKLFEKVREINQSNHPIKSSRGCLPC